MLPPHAGNQKYRHRRFLVRNAILSIKSDICSQCLIKLLQQSQFVMDQSMAYSPLSYSKPLSSSILEDSRNASSGGIWRMTSPDSLSTTLITVLPVPSSS